jgi:Zn-dependent protease
VTDTSTKPPVGDTPPPDRQNAPFARAVPLGRWAGVSVRAHWSVLFTVVLFADLLAQSALPLAHPGASTFAYWLAGLLTSTAFLLTLLAHELAHAVVARHYRVKVERITLWMLGGVTELEGEPPTPRADALIAAVGPATSFAVGAVSAALVWTIGGSGLLGAALTWLAWVSVLLGVFNLLPGAPLDGGRLLRALLWWHYHDRARAAVGAARAGRMLGIVLILFGFLDVLAGAIGGIWLALVGWFIINGATGEQFAGQMERLRGLRADDVMSPVAAGSADWWTVQQLLDRLDPRHVLRPVFPLVDFEGHPSGVITLRNIERVPADRRDDTRLRDLLGPRPVRPLIVERDSQVADMIGPLRLHGSIAVVVDEAGHPIGVITDADLAQAAYFAQLGFHRNQEHAS